MTIIVSGQTFNYREALKNLGGEWDASAKNWRFPDTLSVRDKGYIQQMVGVTISDPRPRETAEEFIDRIIEDRPAIATRDGKTNQRGDDMTYLNYFAEKNPISFFGFSNLDKMTDYIEAISPAIATDSTRNDGWTGSSSFTGTGSMKEALSIARNGWSEGVEKAKEIAETIDSDYALQRKRVYNITGNRANIGRMLMGDPKHMASREPLPGKRIITLFVETAINAGIKQEAAIIRAATIAAMIDIIEISGFSCELIATNIAISGVVRPTPIEQLAVKLKNAGEKLNINDAIFALGHPSFERRFNFAVVGSDDRLRMIHQTMGRSSSAFTDDYPPGKNEFYIPQFSAAIQERISGDTLREKALSLLPLIIPKGLPIEVKKNV